MKPSQNLAALTFLVCLLVYTLACVLSPVSWSPDGRWIAVTRFLDGEEDDEEKTELWIVSPSPLNTRNDPRDPAPCSSRVTIAFR